jgi:hypothetical protein
VELFNPSTTPEEARILTALCLQAIASGWPSFYFIQPKIQGAQPVLDTNSMIRDAADMAATITQATEFRMQGGMMAPPNREN